MRSTDPLPHPDTPIDSDERPYLSTQEAADRLGVSRTTVQQMVESGRLKAWKTLGGHRRIDRAALDALRAAQEAGPADRGTVPPAPEAARAPAWVPASAPASTPAIPADGPSAAESDASAHFRMLVADDDPATRRLYEMVVPGWSLPVALRTVDNGVDALLQVARWEPHLLVLDVRMPGLDGLTVVQRLKDNPAHADLDILIVTGAELTAAERAGLPPRGVAILQKPVPMERLRDYVRSAVARLDALRALGGR